MLQRNVCLWESGMKDLIFAESDLVPIDKFMSEALYREGIGYYMTRIPFGAGGDFITSSDISQLFGETIAVWIIQCMEKMKLSERCILLELGPGRGTLMSDILRVIGRFPQYESLIEVHLVEISKLLQNVQRTALQEAMQRLEIFWHCSIDDLPKGPTIFIANEFFDALPVKQFLFMHNVWYENHVRSTPEGLSITAVVTDYDLSEYFAPEEGIIEKCEAAVDLLSRMEEILVQHGGAGLIVDYGYLQPGYKSTIQAVRNHRYCNFLEYIGECDISSYVDFGALQKSLKNVMYEVTTQREFLYRFGIRVRLEMLIRNATAKQASDLKNGFLRLTENMGTLFKVLLLHCL